MTLRQLVIASTYTSHLLTINISAIRVSAHVSRVGVRSPLLRCISSSANTRSLLGSADYGYIYISALQGQGSNSRSTPHLHHEKNIFIKGSAWSQQIGVLECEKVLGRPEVIKYEILLNFICGIIDITIT